jgi:hypothetical protein
LIQAISDPRRRVAPWHRDCVLLHATVGVAGRTRVRADGGPHLPGPIGDAGLPASTAPRVPGQPMIDREKILAVLHKRFPAAPACDLAAAANAIVGLEDEWEDVTAREPEFGYHFSTQCGEICYLADQAERGGEFRVFKRRDSAA